MLAARLDLAPGLLPAALPLLRQGLQDPDDDVRAACADALVPVAGALHHAGPQVGGTRGPGCWGCRSKGKVACGWRRWGPLEGRA